MRIGDLKFMGVPRHDVDLETISAFIEDEGNCHILS